MSKQVNFCNNPALLKTGFCLACDNSGNLYASVKGDNTVYIVKIDTAGNATMLTPEVKDATYIGMYYLNRYLYICGNNSYVYKISVTTGTRITVGKFTSLPATGTQTITYFAPYFYVLCTNGGSPCVVRMENTTWIASKYITYIASTFTSPVGITVDKNGNLYITDQASGSISQYNTSGTWISKIITGADIFKNALIYNDYLYLSNVHTNIISKYDLSGNLITSSYATGSNGTYGLAFDNEGSFYTFFTVSNNGVNNSLIVKVFTPSEIECFKEDSLILTDKGYFPVQDLRKGDLIKTLYNDFLPIDMIGSKEIYHHAIDERIKDQLYKCSKEQYPGVFEDLILTGCHSILVDEFSSKEEKTKVVEMNGGSVLCRTDNKFRLPACLDHRASVYENAGKYKVYHLALENDNNYSNYGIYANGLLVETSSKRYLKESSNMTFIK